ncbi:hypothetical protein JCM8547_003369 [Rhodosporidiobolus lusitaniae]
MKRGFLLGKKSSTATAPAQKQPAPPPSTSSAVVPLHLPSTSSFPKTPQDSTTLHWTFHPSTEPSLALHATTATLSALHHSVPFFSSTSSVPPSLPSFAPLYDLADFPGKGKGLVASADIAPNSLVLLDRPLLVFAPEAIPRQHQNAVLSHALSRLSKDAQKNFMALSNAFANVEGAYLGRTSTNAFPIVSLSDLPPSANADAVTYTGVFPLAARLNHSCAANCRFEWSAKEWALSVRTNREVRKGEELMVSYVVPFQKRRERREELRVKYRFECQCEWCSLSDEESAKKDIEREKLAEEFMKQWSAQKGQG